MGELRSFHVAEVAIALGVAIGALGACGGATSQAAEDSADVGPGSADDAGAADAPPTCAERVGTLDPYACPSFEPGDR